MSGTYTHAGDDGFVHYAVNGDPEMRWLCGQGSGGSVQREDLDMPSCPQCKSSDGAEATDHE